MMKFLSLILVIVFCFNEISPKIVKKENDGSLHRRDPRYFSQKFIPQGLVNLRTCINYTLDTQLHNVFGFLPLIEELEAKLTTVYQSGKRSMEEMKKMEAGRSFAYFLKGVNGLVYIMVYILNIPTIAARLASNLLPRISTQLIDCVIDGPPRSFEGISWPG